jgi:hypothetical protein
MQHANTFKHPLRIADDHVTVLDLRKLGRTKRQLIVDKGGQWTSCLVASRQTFCRVQFPDMSTCGLQATPSATRQDVLSALLGQMYYKFGIILGYKKQSSWPKSFPDAVVCWLVLEKLVIVWST